MCFCDENEGFSGWRKKYSNADLINYNPIYFPQVTSPPVQCRRTFIPWSRLNGGTYIVSKAAAFKQFLCFRKLSLFITIPYTKLQQRPQHLKFVKWVELIQMSSAKLGLWKTICNQKSMINAKIS